MSKELFDLDYINSATSEKLFLGKCSRIQRYDYYVYPILKKLEAAMRGAFWTPEEISLTNDNIGFLKLPLEHQRIYTVNLLFQTLMDTVQSVSLEECLIPLITSPSLEACFKSLGYFELIHSLSYSHMVRNVYANPEEIFNELHTNNYIKNRTNKEIEIYNKLRSLASSDKPFSTFGDAEKRIILEALVRINALEGVKFYVSFLTTYLINEVNNGAISGSAKIIKLINFDEDKHVVMVQTVLKILQKEKKEGFTHLFDEQYHTMVRTVYAELCASEIEWGKYLLQFVDGRLGITTLSDIEYFMKYYVNLRMRDIGEAIMYPECLEKSDTVRFFENKKKINASKTAAQETEFLSYSIGQLVDDLPEGELNFDYGLNVLTLEMADVSEIISRMQDAVKSIMQK